MVHSSTAYSLLLLALAALRPATAYAQTRPTERPITGKLDQDRAATIREPSGSPIESHRAARVGSLPEPTPTRTAHPPEALIYDNTLGDFIFAPGAGRRVSDDITTITDETCNLARFEFMVSGRANGVGTGPFSVDFALYDACPDLGGAIIPGTGGRFDAPDESDYLVTVEIAPEVDIPVAYPLWLSLTFSRDNAGWYAGAPALTGYSDDVFDFPGHNCGVSFGRFPFSPHGSFWIRLYGRSECAAAFQPYRAFSPVRGHLSPGAGELIADDLQLIVDQCELTAYEVGVSGTGSFTFDLRLPGADAAIAGTRRTFQATGPDPQLARFNFDPPISIPSDVWVTIQTDHPDGKVLLLDRAPAIGVSDESYRTFHAGKWTSTPYPDDWFYFAVQSTITCAGAAPVGACCDMYFPDQYGNATCRDVPEANCAFPRWIEGATCDAEPFDPPCGTSACCLGDGRCEDRTKLHCELGGSSWHRGQFCATAGIECPALCPYSEEPCTRSHPGGGCMDPECCANICAQDFYCCKIAWDDACANDAIRQCSIPPENDDCFSPMPPFGALEIDVPGDDIAAGVWHATDRPDDPGFCCHAETPGAKGHGSVWFKFVATDASIRLDTCPSQLPAVDALVQVFRAEDAATEEAACNSLVPIACADDVPSCPNRDTNPSFCVTNLTPGETYYMMVAAKTQAARGLYRLRVDSPCSVDPTAPVCPCGSVDWIDPPDGVVDARQPHAVQDANLPMGIDRLRVAAPANAANLDCWQLCETGSTGSPNTVTSVTPEDGVYLLTLDRSLTPGAASTVTYASDNGPSQMGTFTSHPANVDGDGAAGADDIDMLIRVLNGTATPRWGTYGTDCNHSGATTAADLLCVINLLNGADAFQPGWNNSPKPLPEGVCP